ncbi:MAG TPA: DUF952 domain-containing protein [Pyrinomonadaceae bacterium]|nr:DUF952 domain-containing protein [Pyrinomonadaceae bacterium]
MTIYHIVLPEIWATFNEKDFYEAESLQTEGFIHCSFAEQIEGVLGRYYQGVEKVLILTIDSEKLTSKLVNEPSTNNEIYPHIYGQINRDAIVEIEEKDLATN